jgi:Fe-S-cluster containining protein
MQCDAGCGECCTIVPVTTEEFYEVLTYAVDHGIEPIQQGLRCPFYQKGTCAVYPVRPRLCQLYGHVTSMECPRHYNVNIPPREEGKIMRRYKQAMEEVGGKTLHEVVFAPDQVMALLSMGVT